MTLIKLDSGYIYDTENFGYYNSDNRIAYFRKPISTSVGETFGLKATPEEANYIMEIKNKQSSFPEAVNDTDLNLRKKLSNLTDQLNARIKELEPQMRPENISERLTLETIVQWMNEVLNE